MTAKKKELVLVTGAAGFIGSNLTAELVKRGYTVRVLVRPGELTKKIDELIKNKKIEIFVGDITDKKAMEMACRGVSMVYHLAAKADLDQDIDEPYWKVNVQGTQNLVESCSPTLKRFVAYSSILATGLPNTKELLTEKYQGTPKHAYGRSKRQEEEYLLEEFKNRKFPVTIIRPTTVYGPGDLILQYFLFKVISEGKFFMIGDGNNLMSYVYVKNLVDATIAAATSSSSLGQIYYINDETPYRYKNVINSIYKVMGKKRTKFYLPYFVAFVGSAVFSFLCKLIGIKPLVYPSRVNTMVLNYAYSIEKAKNDFGYAPRHDLEMGIRETYDWYRKNGYLK